jgi:hypothetical protein
MLKKSLTEAVSKVRPKDDRYNIVELAKETGHTVLRLASYHCQLKPVEFV